MSRTATRSSPVGAQDDVELENYVYSRTKSQTFSTHHHSSVTPESVSGTRSDSRSNSTTLANNNDNGNENDGNEEESYPDGGIRAYSVTLGSFLGLIVNLGMINSIGALQTYISRNQLVKLSEVNISWIFGIFLSIAYAGGLATGPIFDKYGPKWLLIASTLFMFAGLMGAASSTSIWHFILSFIGMGIGNGLGMTPLVGVISHWFHKKRGLTTGLATCGGSVGGLVFPLMLRSLYVQVGYVWAVRVLAFICLACMVVSTLLVKERFTSKKSGGGVTEGKAKSHVIKPRLTKVFKIKDFKYVYVILGSFFAELSLVLLVTYFASYSIAQGVSESTSYLLLTVWNAVGILGRFIPGFISDVYGRFNVNILMLIGYTLTILVLLLPFGPKSHGALWAFAVLGGYCSGSILSLLPACLSQITPVNEMGTKYGILNSLLALANLFGVPIAAAIIRDGTKTQYTHFMIFVGVLAFCGTFFWCCSRVAIVGFKLNIKV
ncbi:uncharacterized protein LODBEIA_P09450 [Lodderomyces beijingensis]|uniref:Major facilitator superfamily (MFS) profile domain-containing protein n=1 Tax=Lodderomyces beijingensis TaxID=1775926 RepID=A0ABP0ZIR0_9ASCO